jgi:glycosyltransferase involved in cell wall biosynthesis
MISAIIGTHDSERLLVPTLAALVPGALTGLLRDVIVADGGSQDGTATVADVSGCRFIVGREPLGARLRAAAETARAPWLLFLRPGTVPEASWVDEATRFIQDAEQTEPSRQAAVFRPGVAGRGRSPLAEAFSMFAIALGGKPGPDQGLLISKQLYSTLSGHRADATDPERDLLRRIGHRRIALLRSSITAPANR